MSGRAFVDTNIFVYARDAGAGEKQRRAAALVSDLWNRRLGCTSIQVLNEYFVTVTQKLKPGMSRDAAWEDVESLRAWNPVELDWQLLERGHSLHLRHGLSWWDALVVAAALSRGCEMLYSEDLAHDAVYEGVRAVNPFR